MNVKIVVASTDIPAATPVIIWKLTELAISVTLLLLWIQKPQISVDATRSSDITDSAMCNVLMIFPLLPAV